MHIHMHMHIHVLCMYTCLLYMQAGMNLFFLVGQAAWIPETKPRPEGGAATVGISSIIP